LPSQPSLQFLALGFPEDRSNDLAGWPDDSLNQITAELALGHRLDQVTSKPLPQQSFEGEFLNLALQLLGVRKLEVSCRAEAKLRRKALAYYTDRIQGGDAQRAGGA
jgi:hypothetical protein